VINLKQDLTICSGFPLIWNGKVLDAV